ncbi:DMT family transporter [Nocardioides marmoraquaticus]
MSRPIGISAGRWLLSAAFVVLWASGFVGVKLATQVAPAETMLLWRSVVLTALLSPWLLRVVRRLRGAELGREVVVGVLSQAVYLAAVYAAIDLGVSSGTTSLMDGLQPLAVAALAGPLLGAAVSARQWAGLALGLVGVVVVSAADLLAPTTTAPWWAYGVPLVGMAGLVAATFVDRRRPRRATTSEALAIHCAVTTVLTLGVTLATGAVVPPWTGDFWFAIAWMTLLATFGGYGLYWLLLERRGVTEVNTLLFLVPPTTVLWGALWFGEPVGPLTVLGLALALTAVLLGRPAPGPTDDTEAVAGSVPRDHRLRTPAAPAGHA